MLGPLTHPLCPLEREEKHPENRDIFYAKRGGDGKLFRLTSMVRNSLSDLSRNLSVPSNLKVYKYRTPATVRYLYRCNIFVSTERTGTRMHRIPVLSSMTGHKQITN